jgi:hypothetical protein
MRLQQRVHRYSLQASLLPGHQEYLCLLLFPIIGTLAPAQNQALLEFEVMIKSPIVLSSR